VGLFDSVDSLFSTALSDVQGLFTPGSGSGGSIVGGLDTGVSPVPVSYPTYTGVPEVFGPTAPMMTSAGSVPMVARAIAAGIPRWAATLPNLWQAIQTKLPMLGSSREITFLLSTLRRYGPTVLAGFIGSAALNELLSYTATHKRRRMNVANTKALRRSMRRLKGFHRLAGRVELQLSRSAGRRRSGRRCATCRKSPCAC